jgi:hypothetical protein
MAKKNKYRSFKTADGTVGYYIDQDNGTRQFHNTEGPAFIPVGDWEKREYYIFGNKTSEKDFTQWVRSWKKPSDIKQPENRNDDE